MFQIFEKTGVVLLLALALLPSSAAASNGLSGRFRGDLGTLRFDTKAETRQVVGAFETGGTCGFLPGQAVLDGTMEGNTFVGHVLLCQTGTACESRFYPLLGFVNPEDGTFSAIVKLDTNCRSPVLGERKVLTLKRVPESEVAAASGTSAAELARGKVDKKLQARAERAFRLGGEAISSRPPDLLTARARAREAISLDQSHTASYLLLGVAEMRLGHVDSAITAYKRSLALNEGIADAHYNLACAYARQKDRELALRHLRRAAELGFNEAGALTQDRDLTALFEHDAEFKSVAERVARNSPPSRRR